MKLWCPSLLCPRPRSPTLRCLHARATCWLSHPLPKILSPCGTSRWLRSLENYLTQMMKVSRLTNGVLTESSSRRSSKLSSRKMAPTALKPKKEFQFTSFPACKFCKTTRGKRNRLPFPESGTGTGPLLATRSSTPVSSETRKKGRMNTRKRRRRIRPL